MKKITTILFTFQLCCICTVGWAQQIKIIVAADGSGNFKSIQAAINSLPINATQPVTIFIKNGKHDEKIYLEKSFVILEGEDKDKTIITQSIARDEWRCAHSDDWGVATINVDGSDITLKNLSIINSYGFDNDKDRMIYCKSDTSALKQKMIKPNGHQMALRTMSGTRFKAINCHFKSFAGDTVSPWNVEGGMFYFKDCIMEGGVDLYCPRGWAYAEGCTFFAHTGDAIIWHDGSANADSKTVLVHCSFDGYNGFKLGRYHRDAQFYLINCNFSNKMADKPISLVASAAKLNWGNRVYFFNCHRSGGDFAWFKNNLQTSLQHISPEEINANWVFANRWNPLIN